MVITTLDEIELGVTDEAIETVLDKVLCLRNSFFIYKILR